MTFDALGLGPELLEGLASLGFEKATPIQEEAIPLILGGKDIIGCAQTGTGKTAAFLLPIIQKIIDNRNEEKTSCLVVVPTRELAVQIDQQLQGLSYFTRVSSIPIYGGSDGDTFSQEKKALSEGASIIIATPGRLIAHLAMNYVNMSDLKFLVLDEADRMLDMGFYQDIRKIISNLPKKRQNLLFSATMPPKIRELAQEVLNDPDEINIAISKPAENIIQVGFSVFDNQKIPLITYLMKQKDFKSVIVFCSTKENTKSLAKELKGLKLSVSDIHSDLDQKSREAVLNEFKAKKLKILVATDILSRGIDIEDVELIINYDVPGDGEDYIHRIGRTARASSTGAAFTLISPRDQYRFAEIEKLIDKTVPKAKVPSHLGETPTYKPPKPKKSGKRSFRRKKKKM